MIVIEIMQPIHWSEVRAIYSQGIATGNATFQQNAPEWAEWDAAHYVHSRVVAMDIGQVIGWAALTPVSSRCVYAGVAEVSVYVKDGARGKGIGKQLLSALIKESEANGIWTLQAGIFPENKASIHIHEQNGFKVVGEREKIGKMNGRWRNTLFLERRSQLLQYL